MSLYRAVSSLDVVDLPEGAVLLRSDTGSCKIEGESARLLAQRVLPQLSSWTPFADLASSLEGYDPDDVQALLDGLVGARLLLSRSARPDPVAGGIQTLVDIGIDQGLAAERLAKLQVGVIGAGELAASIGQLLESAGFDRLITIGRAMGPDAGDIHSISKKSVREVAGQVQLLVVAVDRAMLSARHWANQATLETGCPALFVDVSAIEAVIGPTVLPGETGCYTCFRMRHLATSEAFSEIMAHEQHLDSLKDSSFERPVFPGLRAMAAGATVAEATRLLFAPLNPWLANAILRIDPLTMKFERHEVLRQPDCPHCRGIDEAVRVGE